MLGRSASSAGFTLLELMVALAISAFVLLGVIGIFSSTISNSKQSLDLSRLDYELQTTMSMLTQDIAAAGYWANAASASINPFSVTGSTDLSINADANCILMTYDKNANGSLPALSSSSDDERYGYRLNNSAIQFRPFGAAHSCTAATGVWENLTDSGKITITQFQLTPSIDTIDIDGAGAGTHTVQVRIGTQPVLRSPYAPHTCLSHMSHGP